MPECSNFAACCLCLFIDSHHARLSLNRWLWLLLTPLITTPCNTRIVGARLSSYSHIIEAFNRCVWFIIWLGGFRKCYASILSSSSLSTTQAKANCCYQKWGYASLTTMNHLNAQNLPLPNREKSTSRSELRTVKIGLLDVGPNEDSNSIIISWRKSSPGLCCFCGHVECSIRGGGGNRW